MEIVSQATSKTVVKILAVFIGVLLLDSLWSKKSIQVEPISESGSSESEVRTDFQPTTPIFHWKKYAQSQGLRPTIDFWKKIYSKYTVEQGVIHDSKYPWMIYEVLDFTGLDKNERRKTILQTKKKWRKIMRTLDSIQENQDEIALLEEEVKKVFEMYQGISESSKFLKAAGRRRVRFQSGQKDRFKMAIIKSGRYLRTMERIFQEEGIPLELTRLPYVESAFDLRARSKVGATGLWQFTRATGKLYLKISSIVDERLDPVLSTRAAARLLRDNYQALNSWALSIVAYNHGRHGMMRATRKVGSSDLEEILESYRSSTFGFASRNFFMELIAAIEVEQEALEHFGSLQKELPEEFVRVGVADYISAPVLVRFLGLDFEKFKELNPSFSDEIFAGNFRIPSGSVLRVPAGWGQERGGPRKAFWTSYLEIPAAYKHQRQMQFSYDRSLSSER